MCGDDVRQKKAAWRKFPQAAVENREVFLWLQFGQRGLGLAGVVMVERRSQLQRLLQLVLGAIFLTGGVERHAEMVVVFRTLRQLVHYLGQQPDRDQVISLFVLDPTKSVVDGDGVGSGLLGLRRQRQGYIEVLALYGIDPRQVVLNERIMRGECVRLFEVLLGGLG